VERIAGAVEHALKLSAGRLSGLRLLGNDIGGHYRWSALPRCAMSCSNAYSADVM
jgi:hypothetical protein